MNMPVAHVELTEADRLNGPQTAKGLVYEWSRQRHFEGPNHWPASTFYKIYVEQENAGAKANGIQFDIITVDGDSVSVPPDGGLGDFCDRWSVRLKRHNRVQDTGRAINALPSELRAVIVEMYGVAQRERPKPERAVAEAMALTRIEVIKRLERAYGWLGRDIGVPPI